MCAMSVSVTMDRYSVGVEGRRGMVEQLHLQHRFIAFIISDMVRTIAMAPWRESTVYVTIVSASMDMGI